MTGVHQGVSLIEEPFQLILDQSNERLRKPILPRPEPMKLAILFRGATQPRKASEEVSGKTYSRRNCQRIMPNNDRKKTFICRRAKEDEMSVLRKVSNKVVCMRACGQTYSGSWSNSCRVRAAKAYPIRTMENMRKMATAGFILSP